MFSTLYINFVTLICSGKTSKTSAINFIKVLFGTSSTLCKPSETCAVNFVKITLGKPSESRAVNFVKISFVKSAESISVNFIKISLHEAIEPWSIDFIEVAFLKSPESWSIDLIKIPFLESPESSTIDFVEISFGECSKSMSVNFIEVPFSKGEPTESSKSWEIPWLIKSILHQHIKLLFWFWFLLKGGTLEGGSWWHKRWLLVIIYVIKFKLGGVKQIDNVVMDVLPRPDVVRKLLESLWGHMWTQSPFLPARMILTCVSGAGARSLLQREGLPREAVTILG